MTYLKETIFYGNTLFSYIIAFSILFISALIIIILNVIIVRLLHKLDEKDGVVFITNLIKSIKKRLYPIIFIISLAIALSTLKLPAIMSKHITKTTAFIITVFFVFFICDLLTNFFENYLSKKNMSISGGIVTIFKIVIWTLGILTILSNMGVNVNTFIAGLGVGGIAIAFAAQSIIADLFNYFVIIFDKPFIKGDFIQVGADSGTVEYIGVKTTRIKRNSGEQLLISNTNLISSRIQNYRILEKRRRYAIIGVEYSTPIKKLKLIPNIIKSVIENTEGTEFYSARFMEFGESSLNFEIIYHILSPDYTKYTEIVENINYKIAEEFEKLKVNFAFPSRTLYVNMEKDKK